MSPEEFSKIIKQASDFNRPELLESMMENYPFCQPARMAYVKALQNTEHPDFKNQLRSTAAFVGSREKLWELIEYRPLENNVDWTSITPLEKPEERNPNGFTSNLTLVSDPGTKPEPKVETEGGTKDVELVEHDEIVENPEPQTEPIAEKLNEEVDLPTEIEEPLEESRSSKTRVAADISLSQFEQEEPEATSQDADQVIDDEEEIEEPSTENEVNESTNPVREEKELIYIDDISDLESSPSKLNELADEIAEPTDEELAEQHLNPEPMEVEDVTVRKNSIWQRWFAPKESGDDDLDNEFEAELGLDDGEKPETDETLEETTKDEILASAKAKEEPDLSIPEQPEPKVVKPEVEKPVETPKLDIEDDDLTFLGEEEEEEATTPEPVASEDDDELSFLDEIDEDNDEAFKQETESKGFFASIGSLFKGKKKAKKEELVEEEDDGLDFLKDPDEKEKPKVAADLDEENQDLGEVPSSLDIPVLGGESEDINDDWISIDSEDSDSGEDIPEETSSVEEELNIPSVKEGADFGSNLSIGMLGDQDEKSKEEAQTEVEAKEEEDEFKTEQQLEEVEFKSETTHKEVSNTEITSEEESLVSEESSETTEEIVLEPAEEDFEPVATEEVAEPEEVETVSESREKPVSPFFDLDEGFGASTEEESPSLSEEEPVEAEGPDLGSIFASKQKAAKEEEIAEQTDHRDEPVEETAQEPVLEDTAEPVAEVNESEEEEAVEEEEEIVPVEGMETPVIPEPEPIDGPSYEYKFEKDDRHKFSEWLQLTKIQPITRSEEDEDELEEEPVNKAEETVSEPPTPAKKAESVDQSSIIDNFIQNDPRISPIKKSTDAKPKPEQVIRATRSVQEDTVMNTETLAGVYAQQGHYKKAIQAYRLLRLKNPEKSDFFADQISKLEKKLNS